jgi:hypothetical protein
VGTCRSITRGTSVIRRKRLHLRGQELSLRDIASRLVITKGKKKGQHPSPATVLRMLREHGEAPAAAPARAGSPGSEPEVGAAERAVTRQ